MSTAPIEVVLVTAPLTEKGLANVAAAVKTVHYHPDGKIPTPALQEVQAWLSSSAGLPACVQDVSRLPNLKHLQLLSAGADRALSCPAIARARAAGEVPQFTLSTASGIHADSISQYIVGTLLMILNKLDQQVVHARTKAAWANGSDFMESRGLKSGSVQPNETAFYNRQLRGMTIGFLGYGHIARESARLLKAFNTTIVAANTTGTARVDEGYIPEGTGDAQGSIPDQYYPTTEDASLDAFLRRSEVLVCSLPSTPATRSLLTDEKLALLPPGAILINVGRGDLVSSSSLLTALEYPTGLSGLAIDVTDPEPLPPGHPLWTHPRAIVTPHLSGDAEGEFDLGVEVFLENVRRLQAARSLVNVVDWKKGY